MKTINIFLIILSLVFLHSCYEDDTTLEHIDISDIKISFDLKDTLRVEKNELVKLSPIIEQAIEGTPTEYEWVLSKGTFNMLANIWEYGDYEVISNEKDLEYAFSSIIRYKLRFSAKNKYGASFHNFNIQISTPYTMGYFILSEKENGKGTVSFYSKYTPEQIEAGKTEKWLYNCFNVNNPEMPMGGQPVDIDKRINQYFICCSESKTIYVINKNSFELEATITTNEYDGYKPTKMNVFDNNARAAVVTSEDGKLYEISLLEYFIFEESNIDAQEMTSIAYERNAGYSSTSLVWDKGTHKIYNAFYYMYHGNNTKDVLLGQKMLQYFSTNSNTFVFTESETVAGNYMMSYFSNSLSTHKGSFDFTNTNMTLTHNAPCVVNNKYNSFNYAKDNKVFKWITSTNSNVVLPESAFITLEKSNIDITYMVKSLHEDYIYIGAYEPTSSEDNKGHLYIYNADTGALVEKHENVCGKPIEIFYKPD